METARPGLAASQLRTGPTSARCFPFPSFFALANKQSPPKPGGRCTHKVTRGLGTVRDSPLVEGGCPRRPREVVAFLSHSLSYTSIASPLIGFIHGGPSLNVIMPGSLHLSAFRKSHRSQCFYFQSLLIPLLQLTCTTMSRTS